MPPFRIERGVQRLICGPLKLLRTLVHLVAGCGTNDAGGKLAPPLVVEKEGRGFEEFHWQNQTSHKGVNRSTETYVNLRYA